MPHTTRQPARRFPRPRTAPALLALALAGCAVPTRTPVPTKPASSPATPATARAAAPSAPERSASVAPALQPAERPGDPLVMIGPLDAGADASAGSFGTDRASRLAQPLARGMASWYGPRFHGRRTASGERYDMHALTAAHKTLPFGTKVRVRSVHTGKEVVVRINDRGPYQHQRIIDLSQAAMVALGVLGRGVTEVELLRE